MTVNMETHTRCEMEDEHLTTTPFEGARSLEEHLEQRLAAKKRNTIRLGEIIH